MPMEREEMEKEKMEKEKMEKVKAREERGKSTNSFRQSSQRLRNPQRAVQLVLILRLP